MNHLSPFFNNIFLSATEVSYEMFFELSEYHDSALLAHNSDAFMLARYNFYHPFHTAFNTAYTAWKSAGDTQQGDTQEVKDRLADLSTNLIGDWDDIVRGIYGRKTTQYKSLFPNGHNPLSRPARSKPH